MPAPNDNTNAMQHGLTCGSLPAGAGYVAKVTSRLRVALEAATLEARGQCGLFELATIQTAVRWERHALLSQKWLRNNADALTPDQRLSFSREIARASAVRDKCLRSLGLDRDTSRDVIATLYESTPHADDEADSVAAGA